MPDTPHACNHSGDCEGCFPGEESMPPNPPGIGGVNAAYFIKRLDDARLAKRGVYEAKTLVFSWREVEVLKAILERTQQAQGDK